MNQLLDTLAANQTVDTAIAAVLLAMTAALVGLWLAAAWWTYADLSRRVHQEPVRFLGPAWILVSTPVLLPLSVAAYLLVRPQETLADRRSREILNVLVPSQAESCPGCEERIEAGWRRCPTCATWLAVRCSNCGSWSPPDLELCPFCATERSLAPEVDTLPGFVPVVVGGRAQPFVADPAIASGSAGTGDLPDAPAWPSRAASAWARRGGNHEARGVRRADRAGSASGPGLARLGR